MHTGETLTLLFRSRENGTFELQVKESWSVRTASGSFVPPYTSRQLNTLQKKLNTLESRDDDLREIGHRLFLALCGSETPGTSRREVSEQSVQSMLRSVIQRTLRRRGTVTLTFGFTPGCDEFVRYPGNCCTMVGTFSLLPASSPSRGRSCVQGRLEVVNCQCSRPCACSTSAPRRKTASP